MIGRTVLALGAAVAAICTQGAHDAAQAQEHTFTLHHFLGPSATAHTGMLEPWAKRIEEASDGRIAIEIYPSMSLGGTPPELVRQARDGVVDIVWTVNGYTAGLFPRTEVFELPFIHTNNITATNLAMRELFDTYLAEDYAGLQVLFAHVHAGQGIVTANTPVRTPDDLGGKTMRIQTRTGAWVIEALGANPVGMPVPEFPQALQRQVVDGGFIPWEIMPSLSLEELTNYQIEGYEGVRFGATTFQVSMNAGRWEALPEDLQQVFLDASDEDWLKEVGRVWRQQEDEGIAIAVAAGGNHVVLDEDETEAFRVALEPVVERWIEDVSASGIDGAALVEAAREAVARYDGEVADR